MEENEILYHLLIAAGLPGHVAWDVSQRVETAGYIYVNDDHPDKVDYVMPGDGPQLFRSYTSMILSNAVSCVEGGYESNAYPGFLVIRLPNKKVAADVAEDMADLREEYGDE